MSGMTSGNVKMVLYSLGIKVQDETVAGIVIAPKHEGVRLERGGGIAGEAGSWCITCRRNGNRTASKLASNTQDLKRILLEWMAGSKPEERTGYKLYAKRNKNRFGKAAIWCYRGER